jgi:hypothetical protein
MGIQQRTMQFSQAASVTFSTTGPLAVDFGFIASKVFIANSAGKSVYVSLQTSLAATSDFEVRSSEVWTFDYMRTQILSFTATSSGSGVRVLAFGG